MFYIKREKLVSCFVTLVKKGHLLIIGNPGSGKTWLMTNVAKKLSEENIPNLIIRADSIQVDSISDFKRVLGIDNPIEEALNYISGSKRSILFIDALDAARSEAKQSIYRQFINLVLTRCKDWFIVASIRTSKRYNNFCPLKSLKSAIFISSAVSPSSSTSAQYMALPVFRFPSI